MDTLLKADLFFFVTTIVVAVWGVLLTIIFLYVISIIRAVKRMVERAHEELDSIAADFSDMRHTVKEGVETTTRYARNAFTGISMGRIATFLINTVAESRAQKKRRTRKRSTDDGDEE